MFATFTLAVGKPVTVNLNSVAYFHPADDHTLIFVGSLMLTVRESYDTVAEYLNPEKQNC